MFPIPLFYRCGMIVYQRTAEPQPRSTMRVTPGRGSPTYTVEFINGRAEVPDDIGRYMLDVGLARRTRQILHEVSSLILPRSA